MFSSIKPSISRPAEQRGTAIIETLLIFVPALMFFWLTFRVLEFWQDSEIDRSVALASRSNDYTKTKGIPFIDLYYNGDTEARGGINSDRDIWDNKNSNTTFKNYFYWSGLYLGTNRNGQHAKIRIFTTNKSSKTYTRRMLFYRGVNCWLSLPWSRAQRPTEEKWAKDYLKNTYGLKEIDNLRKPLQLGS